MTTHVGILAHCVSCAVCVVAFLHGFRQEPTLGTLLVESINGAFAMFNIVLICELVIDRRKGRA